MKDFVGSGWAWPVGVQNGAIAVSSREADIEQAMALILLTVPGERVMRPKFGCRIHELTFAPNNASLLARAEQYVAEALTFWEPRVRLEKVMARTDPERPERVLIDIHYQIKGTYDRRSLVFPFYRIPGEG